MNYDDRKALFASSMETPKEPKTALNNLPNAISTSL
jgi:hypothetical protein